MRSRAVFVLAMLVSGCLAYAQVSGNESAADSAGDAFPQSYAYRYSALLLSGRTAQEAQAEIRRLALLERRGADGTVILERLLKLDRKRAIRLARDGDYGRARGTVASGGGHQTLRGNRP